MEDAESIGIAGQSLDIKGRPKFLGMSYLQKLSAWLERGKDGMK